MFERFFYLVFFRLFRSDKEFSWDVRHVNFHASKGSSAACLNCVGAWIHSIVFHRNWFGVSSSSFFILRFVSWNSRSGPSIVKPNVVRPYPQINPERKSTRAKRTPGRTIILTSTPEKNTIERMTMARANKTKVAPVGRKRAHNNKENSEQPMSFDQDFDFDMDPLYRPPPSPKRTRTGRLVKVNKKLLL